MTLKRQQYYLNRDDLTTHRYSRASPALVLPHQPRLRVARCKSHELSQVALNLLGHIRGAGYCASCLLDMSGVSSTPDVDPGVPDRRF